MKNSWLPVVWQWRWSSPSAFRVVRHPPRSRTDWKPEPGYTSLFNGKDLTGWRYYKEKDLTGKTETFDKRFTVKDGIIVANEGKGIKDLYTVKDFNKEFHLKLEFRAGASRPTAAFTFVGRNSRYATSSAAKK